MLVLPVNCVPRIMGAGLAKQFADRYPKAKEKHQHLLRFSGLTPGRPTICWDLAPMPVVFFATKARWQDKSKLEWIVKGLETLSGIIKEIDECPWQRYVGQHSATSMRDAGIAMPALGCGCGGLLWKPVSEAIVDFAEGLPNGWHVRLYRPHNSNE